MQRTADQPHACALCDHPEPKSYVPGKGVIAFICSRCTIHLPGMRVDDLLREKQAILNRPPEIEFRRTR